MDLSGVGLELGKVGNGELGKGSEDCGVKGERGMVGSFRILPGC